MSRIAGREQIEIKPTNNVYTVLVIVSVVVEVAALVALYMRHQALFDANLFS